MSGFHEPVLLAETLRFLRNGPGLYLDATLGDGGHAEALLDAEPAARLLGCDRDAAALAVAGPRLRRFGERVMLARSTFRELPEAHRRAGGEGLAGALLDLGVSSRQIDEPARGMSFRAGGPLDLRMDRERGEPAASWLAGASASEIERVLREHGDVPRAGALARALVEAARAGSLNTTLDLARAVAGRVGGHAHPRLLAMVFQAIRIHVNAEAEDLESALAWLPDVVRPGGVVVTLAYHSGEDRRIKHALRGRRAATPSRRLPAPIEDARLREEPWEPLTRHVVTPTPEERAANPRARSARLRAFRRKP